MPEHRAWALALALVATACDGGDGLPPPSAATASTVATAAPATTDPVSSAAAPSTTSTSATTTSSMPRHDPEDFAVPDGAIVPNGFPRVRAMVTTADGRICELCVWLAEGERRSRGLSSVDDIGPADGMAFVYPEPDTRTFNMEFVVFDLDIAFFDADGAYLDAFGMTACPLGGCRRYQTPPDISFALEVRPGSLPDLGVGPGSTFELTDRPCG